MIKMYPNTAYVFCDVCRKTGIPTTLELADGSLEILCASCAEQEFDPAVSVLPNVCDFRSCTKEAVTFCAKCMDAICTFHENRDGMCDMCSPMMGSYTRGWAGSGHGFDQ